MKDKKVKFASGRFSKSVKVEGFTQQSFAKKMALHPKAIERLASPSRDTYLNFSELAKLSEPLKKVPSQLLAEIPDTYESFGWAETANKDLEAIITEPENCAVLSVPFLPDIQKHEQWTISLSQAFETLRSNISLTDRLETKAKVRQTLREMRSEGMENIFKPFLHPIFKVLTSKDQETKRLSFNWICTPWLVIRRPDAEKSRIPNIPSFQFAEDCDPCLITDELRTLALNSRPPISPSIDDLNYETGFSGSTSPDFSDLEYDHDTDDYSKITKVSTKLDTDS